MEKESKQQAQVETKTEIETEQKYQFIKDEITSSLSTLDFLSVFSLLLPFVQHFLKQKARLSRSSIVVAFTQQIVLVLCKVRLFSMLDVDISVEKLTLFLQHLH